MTHELNERSRAILEAIIEDYIESAEPVGSRAITRRHPVGLSPASVRNVMSDLEELGYLVSPHTSAGRVPTEKGFRFYIDSLLQVRPLTSAERQQLDRYYHLEGLGAEQLVREAGKTLSSLCQFTGIVLAPRVDFGIFRQVEFVKLSGGRILVILVSQSGLVQNRIIEVGSAIDQRELERAANYMNNRLKGLSFQDVRRQLVEEMQQEKARFDQMMQQVIAFSQSILDDPAENHLFIEGASNILKHPDFSNVAEMRQIFQAFETKGRLLQLLDQSHKAEGVQIFIGREAESAGIAGCSLITATYSNAKGIVGSLGVIGPMRMSYSQVIPVVDYTAKVVGRLLELDQG